MSAAWWSAWPTQAALRAGWSRLVGSVAAHRPDLVLDGVLVEAMGPRGLELVVGAKRDADWGPVVLVGLGGVWIEALKDVRLIPADLAEEDIVIELSRLKAAVAAAAASAARRRWTCRRWRRWSR